MAVVPSIRPARQRRGAGGQTLVDLRPGQTGRVSGVSQLLPEAVRRRLSDLGVDDGVDVTLLRRAPLGDPCLFRVCDYDLSLRCREAGAVYCELPGASVAAERLPSR